MNPYKVWQRRWMRLRHEYVQAQPDPDGDHYEALEDLKVMEMPAFMLSRTQRERRDALLAGGDAA